MVYRLNCPLTPASSLHVLSVGMSGLFTPLPVYTAAAEHRPGWETPAVGYSVYRPPICQPKRGLRAADSSTAAPSPERPSRLLCVPIRPICQLKRELRATDSSKAARAALSDCAANIGSVLSNSPVEVVFVDGIVPFKLAVAEDVGLGCSIGLYSNK